MLNVAVIGIGNISLLFDYNKDDSSRCLSHIKAIYTHNHFTLKYIVDIEDKNITKVKNFFPNVKYFNNYKLLIHKNDIDILVISTPTSSHFNILEYFKDSSIQLFFAEKPLFNSFNDYKNLDSFFKDKLLINYTRRFDKSIQELKKNIKNKILKNPQKIIINYCKGLKNNGSHMIDLLNFLFFNNTIKDINILSSSIGFSDDDLCYDLFIQMIYEGKIIPIYFISHDYTTYNLIEFNIYFENKFVKYLNSKNQIEYFDIIDDKYYPTYKVFSDDFKISKLMIKQFFMMFIIIFINF